MRSLGITTLREKSAQIAPVHCCLFKYSTVFASDRRPLDCAGGHQDEQRVGCAPLLMGKRLVGEIEAGAMDGWDDQIDAHRREEAGGEESGPARPPSGAPALRPPLNGNGEQWVHRVYDFMAQRTEWVSIPQMIRTFDASQHSIYAGVERSQ